MRRLFFSLLCCSVLASTAWAIDTEPPFDDPAKEALYDRLIHEVRCLVCQNQTIGDSTAPLAADLRREIRRMVSDGQTENEITEFLLQRYGDFVLYKPRFSETTAALWLAPLILLAVGGVTLATVVYRRRSLPSDVDADENGRPGEGM